MSLSENRFPLFRTCANRKARPRPGFSQLTDSYRHLACAMDICSSVFMAHSLVQRSLNSTTPLEFVSLARQVPPTVAVLLVSLVELIAHSLVQVSRNRTAPVSRYSLIRHVSVAAAAGADVDSAAGFGRDGSAGCGCRTGSADRSRCVGDESGLGRAGGPHGIRRWDRCLGVAHRRRRLFGDLDGGTVLRRGTEGSAKAAVAPRAKGFGGRSTRPWRGQRQQQRSGARCVL